MKRTDSQQQQTTANNPANMIDRGNEEATQSQVGTGTSQSVTIVDARLMNAVRPRKREYDEFFCDGNELAHKDADVIVYYAVADTAPITPEPEPAQLEEDESEETPSFPIYSCYAPHCRETFDSIFSCDEHYNERHIFECNSCNCVMPNEFLLDLVSAVTGIMLFTVSYTTLRGVAHFTSNVLNFQPCSR